MSPTILGLTVLPIAPYGPCSHDEGEESQRSYLMSDVGKASSSDEDGADGVDEVMHGIDIGGLPRTNPVGSKTRPY